jgi:hypothetical protein
MQYQQTPLATTFLKQYSIQVVFLITRILHSEITIKILMTFITVKNCVI